MDDNDLANIVAAVAIRLGLAPAGDEGDLVVAAERVIREADLNPARGRLECGACGSCCIVGRSDDYSDDEE